MAKHQITTKRTTTGTTEERAAKVVDAISELMAAHELVWRHGGQPEGAKMVRNKAVALLVDALENAGCLST